MDKSKKISDDLLHSSADRRYHPVFHRYAPVERQTCDLAGTN